MIMNLMMMTGIQIVNILKTYHLLKHLQNFYLLLHLHLLQDVKLQTKHLLIINLYYRLLNQLLKEVQAEQEQLKICKIINNIMIKTIQTIIRRSLLIQPIGLPLIFGLRIKNKSLDIKLLFIDCHLFYFILIGKNVKLQYQFKCMFMNVLACLIIVEKKKE